jgi:pimeloyl-ACP methyl ester carboxylesterase
MTYVAETARLPNLLGRRVGSGPSLLLLPGLGSTLTEFRAVLPSLAQRYDVLALELPGQGGSPALRATIRPTVAALTDAVEQELDRQGVTVPHVLGVSLGGRLGLELARRQRARSVVAIGPTGPLTPPERMYQVAMLAASRLAFSAVARAADTLMRPVVARAAALAPLRARAWRTPPDEAAALMRAFAGAEDFWRLLSCAILPEATVDYRAVRCPVRIAQGTHDMLCLSQAAWLTILVPGARFRVLPFAGHSSIADVPQRVIDLVDEAVAAAEPPHHRRDSAPRPDGWAPGLGASGERAATGIPVR